MREVLFAHAVAGFLHPHDGQAAKIVGKVFQQRRAGGGTQLTLNIPGLNGHSLKKQGGGGCGNGENPVGAPDGAASHGNWGHDHLIGANFPHQQAHGGDVRNGVHGADLVEVDLLNRNAVDAAFRLGDEIVHGQNVQLDHGGDGQSVHDFLNALHAAVNMVVMVTMEVLVLLHSRHPDGKVGSRHAAFDAFFPADGDAGDAETVHFCKECRPVGEQLQQRRGEHVPGGAHGAFDVQRFHPLTSMWLIMFARYPAPKPLSMFTTDTPLAQELSILSSAATPPKDAP